MASLLQSTFTARQNVSFKANIAQSQQLRASVSRRHIVLGVTFIAAWPTLPFRHSARPVHAAHGVLRVLSGIRMLFLQTIRTQTLHTVQMPVVENRVAVSVGDLHNTTALYQSTHCLC